MRGLNGAWARLLNWLRRNGLAASAAKSSWPALLGNMAIAAGLVYRAVRERYVHQPWLRAGVGAAWPRARPAAPRKCERRGQRAPSANHHHRRQSGGAGRHLISVCFGVRGVKKES